LRIKVVLKGGQKEKFIAENRDFILKYCQLFGVDDCLKQFKLTKETLENIEDYPERVRVIEPLSQIDKVEITSRIAIESTRELRHEVNALKKQFEEFQDAVSMQLVNKIFKPIMETIKLPASIEKIEDKTLNLEDITPKALQDTENKIIITDSELLEKYHHRRVSHSNSSRVQNNE